MKIRKYIYAKQTKPMDMIHTHMASLPNFYLKMTNAIKTEVSVSASTKNGIGASQVLKEIVF